MNLSRNMILLPGDQLITAVAAPMTTRNNGTPLSSDDINFLRTFREQRSVHVVESSSGSVQATDDRTGETLTVPLFMIAQRITDPNRNRERDAAMRAELQIAFRGAIPGAVVGAVIGGMMGGRVGVIVGVGAGGGVGWALLRGLLFLGS